MRYKRGSRRGKLLGRVVGLNKNGEAGREGAAGAKAARAEGPRAEGEERL